LKVDAKTRAAVKFKTGAFGSGTLFAPGGHSELLGARVNPRTKVKADFVSGGPVLDADPEGIFVPSYVQANLPDVKSDPGTILVAVNDVVVATTGAWERDGMWMTGVNVPESSFRKGKNRIGLYAVPE